MGTKAENKAIVCELCDRSINKPVECDHPKNGYCAVFRLGAAIEKVKKLERRNNK